MVSGLLNTPGYQLKEIKLTETAFYPAFKLARMIRNGKISSRELLEIYLSRIEQFNKQINAVVTMDIEQARKQAFLADEAQAKGRTLGPLHGVPVTIKDGFETAGMRTTSGAPAYKNHIPHTNAIVVQRYVDAGAVIIGKTNVPMFCADSQTHNELFGISNNPWDLDRSPGGSSGGAAAAVAAGFCGLEVGSDIAGSIRVPASWTGIYGHRPTYGIVPFKGHIPPPPGVLAEADLSVAGPLARSSEDIKLAMKILAGPDQVQATAWKFQLPKPRAKSLKEYRIAAWLDDDAIPVDDEVRKVLYNALEALRKAGAKVDEKARPDIQTHDTLQVYRKLLIPIMASGLTPDVFEMLIQIAKGNDKESELAKYAVHATQLYRFWLSANAKRHKHRALWGKFFEDYDVLLCPVVCSPAILHDTKTEQLERTIRVNGKTESYNRLLEWVGLFTHVYLPATSAPVGQTENGLPVGLQIVGPYLEDFTTIDFARRISKITGGFQPPPGF